MSQKVIFLDRDGVVNYDFGYVFKIKNFEFVTGIFEACKFINSQGFEIIIVTNQSGISREMYTKEQFLSLNKWMLKEFHKNGINILDVFFCPHNPNDNCSCRKPLPGMFFEAQKKHKVDMHSSWLIGDKETDIDAATAANIGKKVLVRSGHPFSEAKSKADYIIDSIADIRKVLY